VQRKEADPRRRSSPCLQRREEQRWGKEGNPKKLLSLESRAQKASEMLILTIFKTSSKQKRKILLDMTDAFTPLESSGFRV
jgi:hypothetical protein